MRRSEDPCRDPASEMRDDHFDPDDREKRRLEALVEQKPPYTVEQLQKVEPLSFVNQRFSENPTRKP